MKGTNMKYIILSGIIKQW